MSDYFINTPNPQNLPSTRQRHAPDTSQYLSEADQIHARAVEVSSRYKRAEADLIEILQQAEEHRVFLKRGHSSLFQYVVEELGFSESTAYGLITVARSSRQVPELKAQLRSGKITLSNARRIVSVLTPQNQAEWLSKASTLSSRQLEKEVIKVRSIEATPERASYVSYDRIKLELGLSEREMLRLRRVQDLMSQVQKRALSLEEVIEALNNEYLRRHDPVEKAKRHRVKQAAPLSKHDQTEAPTTSNQTKTVKTLFARRVDSNLQATSKVEVKREPIPATVLHQVNLRDQRRCTHIKQNGSRCNQARWIEIHHKVPVSHGGPNTPDNLVTLCSIHHKFAHL